MNELERLCIKVPKVYDWITNQAEKKFHFNIGDIDFFTEEDPENQKKDTLVSDVCSYFLPDLVNVRCVLVEPEPSEDDNENTDICREVGERRDVFVEEFDTELQIVKVQKQGQFQIILESDNNNGCDPLFSEPTNFFVLEKFVLCAPEGTDVVCEIYDFDCEGSFICNGNGTDWTIDLVLLICQSIQVEAEVKIEIEGRICQPRPEIILPIVSKECPEFTFPPQCPTVFPSTNTHY